VAEVVEAIRRREEFVVDDVDGVHPQVVVANTAGGMPFLRTTADEDGLHFLLNLPEPVDD
jgi:hypothetical protein